MNQFWKDIGIAVVMGLIVPAVLLAAVVSFSGKRSEIPKLTEPIMATETGSEAELERGLRVSVLDDDGQVDRILLHDYLTGVVLAEMPVSFEDEALKAQSVVARTYTRRAMNGATKHQEADVCTDAACCQGYLDAQQYLDAGGTRENVQRISNLITETDGQVLTYEGDLIEATYFSCSGGVTEDAVAVWGTDVPYLQSVSSPGEEHATHYTDSVTFESDEFASKLGLALDADPEDWFSDITYTDGGGIATMVIGGESFTGTQLRKLLGLRSTAFTVAVQDHTVTIQTRGYGHRVGMSQYGADAMAATGSTYEQILAHYYQGTELANDFR